MYYMGDAEVLVIQRFQQGVVGADGRRQKGPYTRLKIAADVQPVRGETVRQELGLDRTTRAKWIFTSSKLRTLDEATDLRVPPDRVEIDGELYEIHTVEDWGRKSLAEGLKHYRCLAVRRELS